MTAPNARTRRIALGVTLALFATPAAAQREVSDFNIPEQTLRSALLKFSDQSNVIVVVPDESVFDRMVPALSGRLSNEQALATLLAGSNVAAQFDGPRRVRLVPQASVAPPPEIKIATAPVPLKPDEIIVTGTRIRGVVPIGSETVAIDRHMIELAGRSSATELLRVVPQNTSLAVNDEVRVGVTQTIQNTAYGSSVNLRGLGPAATLVLFNGHRMAPASAGAFVDISQIPLSAIERIEIVADGASSIYGSDAIGGVINFILRRDFQGVETTVRNEFADGFNRFTVGATGGTSWDSGSLTLTYEHHHQTALAGRDRAYYTSDLRPFGGPDLRITGNIPGTISANGTTYAIPQNQDGRNLSAASLVAGTSNPYDNNLDASILPTQRRNSLAGSVQQDVGDRISLNADGFYSRRQFGTYIPANTTTLTVPRSNPFFVSPVAGAQTVTVLYSMREDLGIPLANGTSQNYLVSGGASMKLGSSWRAELSASYAADITHERGDNIANTARLNAALADTNPATAFNPFASHTVSSQATLDAIRGFSADRRQRFRLTSESARADGELIDLPAGAVRLAIGVEHRVATYKDASISFTGAQPTQSSASDLKRRTDSLDTELFIPVVSPTNNVPWVHRFDLSAAVRTERYSDVGRTTNPKFGVRWSPIEDVSLRGSWGTSFRAPLLTQLGDPGILTNSLADARSPTGRTTAILINGNNRDLKPETATTWSVGADYAPPSISGLKISATYFSIDYRDRILNIAAEASQVLLRDDLFGGLVIRNPSATQIQALLDSPFFLAGLPKPPVSQVGAIVDARFNNVGVVHESGYDISASWELRTSAGVFVPTVGLAWITDYSVGRTASAPILSALNHSGSPIDLRGRAGLSWVRDAYDASFFVNYINAYHNFSLAPVADVGSFTTVDAQIGYSFGCPIRSASDCRVRLSAQNLLDQRPPLFINTPGRVAYDPEQATATGRVIAVDLSLRF
ncbi:TonB-dependent receptor [Roseiterribacter gracilis]|uniref:TonB-dependent receptor n=1 Tax=Roseiterribacter gracilis TaxID=2812848 RepID=UPI003B436171